MTFNEPDSTMDKPATSQPSQDQPDIDQPDINPTKSQATKAPSNAPVDPEEENIAEVEQRATGETEVLNADSHDKAKKVYSTLYDVLFTQVLPKQPVLFYANKEKVLSSILKQDGTYVMDAETWYTRQNSH